MQLSLAGMTHWLWGLCGLSRTLPTISGADRGAPICTSHNYAGAQYYLSLATKIHKDCCLALRMLGRAYLISGDYAKAATKFSESVALKPCTVMGHQNYTGRYDILNYKPLEW